MKQFVIEKTNDIFNEAFLTLAETCMNQFSDFETTSHGEINLSGIKITVRRTFSNSRIFDDFVTEFKAWLADRPSDGNIKFCGNTELFKYQYGIELGEINSISTLAGEDTLQFYGTTQLKE